MQKPYRIFNIINVADLWHFGVDPNPDPRVHATESQTNKYGSGCGTFYYHHWPLICQGN